MCLNFQLLCSFEAHYSSLCVTLILLWPTQTFLESMKQKNGNSESILLLQESLHANCNLKVVGSENLEWVVPPVWKCVHNLVAQNLIIRKGLWLMMSNESCLCFTKNESISSSRMIQNWSDFVVLKSNLIQILEFSAHCTLPINMSFRDWHVILLTGMLP